MSSEQKLYFSKYDIYKGLNENFVGDINDDFNRTTIQFMPFRFKVDSEFAKKTKTKELKEMGKREELRIITDEQKNLSLQLETSNTKLELQRKLTFMNQKYKALKNTPSENWEFTICEIIPDLTGKITASKHKYNSNDIQILAKVLVKIFRHAEIKAHKYVQNNIKEYVNLPLRINWDYELILGEITSNILTNALSYFVVLGKADFVSMILQSIDIFTKKKSEASELYREILRLGNPAEYERLLNQDQYEDEYKEGNMENTFEELEIRLEDKRDKDNYISQEQKVFRSRVGETFIDKLYEHLDKLNKENINNKKYCVDDNSYIWRYTKKVNNNEIVNWVISGYDAPDDAHPKYSYYINLNKFLKFVVINKNFFAKKNLNLIAPSLNELISSSKHSDEKTQHISCQKTSCWNGNNQSIKDAINLPIQPQITKKENKKEEQNKDKIFTNYSINDNYIRDHDYIIHCNNHRNNYNDESDNETKYSDSNEEYMEYSEEY